MNRTALVTGATGNQGGATARHLLSRGWTVRALVRDPAKPAAQELQDSGAILARGDLDDVESLRAAMTGADGVFSVQALAWDEAGLAAEVRRGSAVADIALETGAHLVYSSVGGADRNSGIAHFESKAAVEAHIQRIGVPATVLRPAFFMSNLPYVTSITESGERVLSLPLDPATSLQMIAPDDIGFFAATALDSPQEFIGAQLEIAGDEQTPPQVAEIFQRVTGVPTRFEPGPLEGRDRMYEWFDESGYQADILALRRLHPALQTLEEYLQRQAGGHEVPA
ncbi:NmrA/HSCARG family protein [Saccharopolyspora sp. WRP15-2]|uniref:NmrA/HSCARG family protein n=1 Tax=Saccharopolyspora oryzae TaxID=2997343 RepID=A0ABT4VB91_9PSEU|nr:NmrA/HSCARG family protein [Saccharopolyspora oryzae]MDA3631222.1 NmrA/HSCARG family protein [Saccharopolyspora oryzae]